MQTNSLFQLKGSMTAVLTKADGTIEVRHKDNMIVDSGFDFVANAIGNAGARPACMSHIAVGTDSTASVAADNALHTELARQAADFSHVAGTKTFTLTTTYAPGVATGAITEAGVFNDPAAGSMLDRVTFGVINKAADDTLAMTFTFTMSQPA